MFIHNNRHKRIIVKSTPIIKKINKYIFLSIEQPKIGILIEWKRNIKEEINEMIIKGGCVGSLVG